MIVFDPRAVQAQKLGWTRPHAGPAMNGLVPYGEPVPEQIVVPVPGFQFKFNFAGFAQAVGFSVVVSLAVHYILKALEKK